MRSRERRPHIDDIEEHVSAAQDPAEQPLVQPDAPPKGIQPPVTVDVSDLVLSKPPIADRRLDPVEPVPLTQDESEEPTEPGVQVTKTLDPKTTRRTFLAMGVSALGGGVLRRLLPEESAPVAAPTVETSPLSFEFHTAPEVFREELLASLLSGGQVESDLIKKTIIGSMTGFEVEWGVDTLKEEIKERTIEQHATRIAEGLAFLCEELVQERREPTRAETALVKAWLEVTSNISYALDQPFVDHYRRAEKVEHQPKEVQLILADITPYLPSGFMRFSDGARTVEDQKRQFRNGANTDDVRERLDAQGLPDPNAEGFDWSDKEVLKKIQKVLATHPDPKKRFLVSIPSRHAIHVKKRAADFAIRPELKDAIVRNRGDKGLLIKRIATHMQKQLKAQSDQKTTLGASGLPADSLEVLPEISPRQMAVHIQRPG